MVSLGATEERLWRRSDVPAYVYGPLPAGVGSWDERVEVEDFLHIVRTQEVHLVILDMHMPKLTGLETLILLKQFKAMIPCIILSAALDEAICQQAEIAKAFDVLSKPISHQRITSVVDQAMRRTYNWPA